MPKLPKVHAVVKVFGYGPATQYSTFAFLYFPLYFVSFQFWGGLNIYGWIVWGCGFGQIQPGKEINS